MAKVSTVGKLPRDLGQSKVQVFNPHRVETISGAGNFTVGNTVAIMSDTDITVYINSDTSNTFDLSANIPLGVTSMTTLHVGAACALLIM